MLRLLTISVVRSAKSVLLTQEGCRKMVQNKSIVKNFASLTISNNVRSDAVARYSQVSVIKLPLLQTLLRTTAGTLQQSRNVTKFSLNKGKRKSVKAVIKRFKRLHWGGWIRTRTGRHKKLWKKSSALRKRLREHVFVNGQQSTLLDKMVTHFWRRPKYYIDDPYSPYHTRSEFNLTRGRTSKY